MEFNKKNLEWMFSNLQFDVTILPTDEERKKTLSPEKGLIAMTNSVQVTKKSVKSSKTRNSEIANALFDEEAMKIIKDGKKNKDIKECIKMVLNYLNSGGDQFLLKAVENAVQAEFRNPILRGDLNVINGNKKGYGQYAIDSGQLFRAIKCKRVKSSLQQPEKVK
jgi:hypothetical protein